VVIALVGGAFAVLDRARATAPAPTANVTILYRSYQPSALTVETGTTVQWKNAGLGPHTVTADNGEFNSGRMAPGEAFSVTYATAGTFTYSCLVHPEMHGGVTVLAPGSAGLRPPVKLSLAHKHGAHGVVTVVTVRIARPGAQLALQLAPGKSPNFHTIAQGPVGPEGKATFRLGAGAHGRLRVLVSGAGTAQTLMSPVVRTGR